MNQNAQLKDAVEDFLYREADYMDRHRYDEWFDLWTEDLTYWVPCNEDDYDPARHVSLIFDDRKRLNERIFRLKSKLIHSQTPRSRLSRIVSNIRITDQTSTKTVTVESRFCLTEARKDQHVVWAGRQVHVFERQGADLKLSRKTVYLVDNDAVLSNLTFLI